MKLFYSTFLLLLLSVGCVLPAADKAAVKAAPASNANTVGLQLPPAIYAVPGVESAIYFDNIVNVINPDFEFSRLIFLQYSYVFRIL